ncbi:hypothetical protein M9979_10385 [Sphingomonas sp. RP10(2022)]|uniref:Uncharacterized protein n=1 Tax=Sphingomonas liriopis TaxID=2949094 RepID=A0A9X2HSW3_9SPHN|nr:hypothetical protein [Sphingomonas liriopis]MCP3735277.1 hypothetical protein [Sphingomonas liriopis]
MIRRPLAPLWFAVPSRFAGVSARNGWLGLAALAGLLLATLLVFATPVPSAALDRPAAQADGQTDLALYETIVENVRHGGGYYATAAEAMRAGDYPLKPFVTMRLPTLAVVQGALPHGVVVALLYVLAVAVVLAWWTRVRGAFARTPPRVIAMVLLAGGMIPFVQSDLIAFHEIWAGLFLALSLGVYRSDDWLPAVALGLAAALIRETAGLYLALMAVMALAEGERREATGWLVAGAVLATALAAHAHGVAAVVRPLDAASPGWAGQLGFGFFVRTMIVSTGLVLAPAWLAAPLVGLALFGWAAWRDALALRVLVLLCAYAAVLSVFGRLDTFYWGLLVAPLMLVGLAGVPDGLRDLATAALDRRQITVKRIVR